jgi:hypothetical protein
MMSSKRSNTTAFNSNIKWILMSIFMLLLIIVIVRLTNNIPFNVLVLNLGGKDQIASTTNSSSEPVYNSTPPVKTSTAPIEQQYKSSNSDVIEKTKTDQVLSSPILKNERLTQQKSNSVEEPEVKIATTAPAKRNDVPVEEYMAPKKVYSSNTPPRKATYNFPSNQAKDNSYSDQGNVNASSDQTNGNSPYAYNRSSAYSPKTNTSNTNSSKAVDTKKYNSNSSRYFSQSEMNEFIRQYPNRSTYIHFVNFGIADNEMEDIRSQIIGMLNSNGYYEIDKNWFIYNGYTEIKEVHFGVNGNTAVNFYIPPIK